MTNNYLEEFCASYNLKNLIKEPTCFKNIDNPTLIDHILTDHPKSFHSSSAYETGLSDFHKLTLTVLKTFHVKHKPKIIQYRDFSHCDNASLRADLLQELSLKNVLPGEFEKFKYISSKVLNIHAPIKEKHVKCNQSPSWVKDITKSWHTIKPNCTGKIIKGQRITLVEGDKVIIEEKDVVKISKDHFEKIVDLKLTVPYYLI